VVGGNCEDEGITGDGECMYFVGNGKIAHRSRLDLYLN
jgi:hypothetical protein